VGDHLANLVGDSGLTRLKHRGGNEGGREGGREKRRKNECVSGVFWGGEESE